MNPLTGKTGRPEGAGPKGSITWALAIGMALAACSPRDQARQREAEAAWSNVVVATKRTPLPAEWRTRQPTPQEMQEFRARHAQRMLDGAQVARDFQTRFPWHSNAPVALQKEYELLGYAAGLGRTEAFARLDQLEKLLVDDPTLPPDQRFTLKSKALERRAVARQAEGSAAVLAELEKGARELLREFPDRPELWSMLMISAQGTDSAKARAICEEVLASPHAPEPAKTAARQHLELLAFEGKPFEHQFTALDGRPMDSTKLRGKVLLIDFWATWCAPCIAELPNLKATYAKFHAQGFEILGISLDTDRAALENLVQKEGLTWPQHFDSADGNSAVADRYKISGIPAMWLVDKRGVIRDINARANLAEKVEKLLQE
jgi:peroxiredoxin